MRLKWSYVLVLMLPFIVITSLAQCGPSAVRVPVPEGYEILRRIDYFWDQNKHLCFAMIQTPININVNVVSLTHVPDSACGRGEQP